MFDLKKKLVAVENVGNFVYFVAESSITSYNLQTNKREESPEEANTLIFSLAGFPNQDYLKLVIQDNTIALMNRTNESVEIERPDEHPSNGHINVVDYFDSSSQENLTLVVCSVQVLSVASDSELLLDLCGRLQWKQGPRQVQARCR